MTIKTLTFIHQLLIDEEARRKSAVEITRKARNEAEERDADNLGTLEELYQNAREGRNKAYNALAEFEAHEW